MVVSRMGEARSIVISTVEGTYFCGFSIVAVDLVVKLWILNYHT